MKHIRTFEKYSEPINEEFLGKTFKKVKDSIKAKVSNFLAKKMKNNPEFDKAMANVKIEAAKFAKADPEGAKKLAEKMKANEAPIIDGEVIKESLILEGKEWKEITGKLINYFGLSTAGISLISAMVVAMKIILTASTAASLGPFGLTLGTLGAIFMGSTVVSGVFISTIGEILKDS